MILQEIMVETRVGGGQGIWRSCVGYRVLLYEGIAGRVFERKKLESRGLTRIGSSSICERDLYHLYPEEYLPIGLLVLVRRNIWCGFAATKSRGQSFKFTIVCIMKRRSASPSSCPSGPPIKRGISGTNGSNPVLERITLALAEKLFDNNQELGRTLAFELAAIHREEHGGSAVQDQPQLGEKKSVADRHLTTYCRETLHALKRAAPETRESLTRLLEAIATRTLVCSEPIVIPNSGHPEPLATTAPASGNPVNHGMSAGARSDAPAEADTPVPIDGAAISSTIPSTELHEQEPHTTKSIVIPPALEQLRQDLRKLLETVLAPKDPSPGHGDKGKRPPANADHGHKTLAEQVAETFPHFDKDMLCGGDEGGCGHIGARYAILRDTWMWPRCGGRGGMMSADTGRTTLARCEKCGLEWKFNDFS